MIVLYSFTVHGSYFIDAQITGETNGPKEEPI